jgi:hypothetical protein
MNVGYPDDRQCARTRIRSTENKTFILNKFGQ